MILLSYCLIYFSVGGLMLLVLVETWNAGVGKAIIWKKHCKGCNYTRGSNCTFLVLANICSIEEK